MPRQSPFSGHISLEIRAVNYGNEDDLLRLVIEELLD